MSSKYSCVEIKCNGFGNKWCDWSCLYHIEGLNPEKFKCPICNCNSCSLKYFEKLKPIEYFNLMVAMNRFLRKHKLLFNHNYKKELLKKHQQWEKEHDQNLNEWLLSYYKKQYEKLFWLKEKKPLQKIYLQNYKEIIIDLEKKKGEWR